MNKDKIAFTQTQLLKPLMKDYLDENPKIKHLYSFSPNLNGLKQALKEREKTKVNRSLLVSALIQQYKDSNLLNSTTKKQIELLNHHHTYTITTGHQLNLFGGTQYFIYKIVETIVTAKLLQKDCPEYHIVPIFWMASEDHDFEEINHFWLDNKKYTWDEDLKGPVGRFNPKPVLDLLEQIAQYLDAEPITGKYLHDLFSKAYSLPSLAQATRCWVNALFEQHGLVIIDGDDAALKSAFAPIIKQELSKELTNKACEKTNQFLSNNGYHLQVHDREINLFYMQDGLRARITKNGESYQIIDSSINFTESEILNEVDANPERFSPNALMRPMYQESILPNLCYIGGSGEMAYWLQLRTAFEEHKVFYPQILVRNSIVWIENRLNKKLEKLPLEWTDFLNKKETIVQKFAEKHESAIAIFEKTNELEQLIASLNQASKDSFKEIEVIGGQFAAKQKKELKKFKHDIRKAVKTKEELELRWLHEIYDRIYPNNVFQERIETFIPSYLNNGRGYLEILFEKIKPFKAEINLVST